MRPDVNARSTKNGPKLLLARSRVPRSELNKYVNPPADVLIGNVASSISSASRDCVARRGRGFGVFFDVARADRLIGQEERQHLPHGLLGERIRRRSGDNGREGDDPEDMPAIIVTIVSLPIRYGNVWVMPTVSPPTVMSPLRDGSECTRV